MIIIIQNDECIDDLQINNLFLIQKKSGFKFGIDAVLLADFAKNFKSERTIDLCTGTGIIPILLTAKTNTPHISAIEIQDDISDMAMRSVIYNKLDDRVNIVHGNLKNATDIFGRASFNAVTCNPPYMKIGSALLNENDNKIISRHEILCTLEDVIKVSNNLLKTNGHFFMIHRPSRLVDIICIMREYRLEPKRIQFVHSSVGKAPNLVLIEGASRGGKELRILEPLYVYNSNGTYTDAINTIYGRTCPETEQ